jgi:hypothetical protein
VLWSQSGRTNIKHGINGQYDLPWFIIGDFSAILFSHEKEGGPPTPSLHASLP